MSVFILFTFCSISGTFKTFKFTSLFLRQKKKKTMNYSMRISSRFIKALSDWNLRFFFFFKRIEIEKIVMEKS